MAHPPNILLITVDDLNSWIGVLERHPQVKTPNIDRLARQSLHFTQAYCTAPYCNASRMSVFTGLLPATNQIYQNEPFFERAERPKTYIEAFKDAGYYTFGAGKVFHGYFDYASAGANQTDANWVRAHNHERLWNTFRHIKSEPMPKKRPLNGLFDFEKFDTVDPWNHHLDWGILPDELEESMPDHQAVEATIEFLQAPPSRQPFFCAMGLYRPHLPWYVPKRFFDLYPLEGVVVPVVKEDDLDDVPEIARAWALTPNDHETITQAGQWQAATQGYLASISYCDEMIGKLLDGLQASGAAENTIVLLWSDNGFHLGEKLHWRKFVLWEEATRVPLILRPPDQSGLTACEIDVPVSTVDIMPTLMDLAGLDNLPGTDGQTLLPYSATLREQSRPVITTWQKGNHSMRYGPWRYTKYRDGSEELYNHTDDPMEWTNLVGRAKFSDVHNSLKDTLDKYLQTQRLEDKI